MFYRFWRTFLVGLAALLFGTEVRGREHLPPTGVYIVAPSHRSTLDIPLAAAVTRRRLRFMAKQEIFNGPVWSWIFHAVGAVPVDRAGTDRAALKAVEGALLEGEPVVIFPEGTRHHGPELGPIASGTAYVALKAGVSVVPVGIGGTGTLVVRRRGVPWLSRVTVVVGPPIVVERVDGAVKRSAITELDATLRVRLQAVFDEAAARSARRSAGRRASDQAGQGV